MYPVLQKAALLFVADQFIFWRSGVAFGLDFLGFIALASVLASWVATRPHRFGLACIAIGAIAVVRFGLGPRVGAAGHGAFADWLVGVGGAANISYPFAPWMALPMLGLAVGMRYPTNAAPASVVRHWRWGSLAAAVVFLCLSAGAAAVGASFFRWGTMGAGFFVLCFGVIAALGWLSAVTAGALPRAASLLGLRGVASFAVVPVHYAVIDLADALIGRRLSEGEFVVTAIVLVVVSCGLSKVFAKAVQRLVAQGQAALAFGLIGIALVCAIGLLLASPQQSAERLALMVGGQLAIAGLLGFRAIKRVGQSIKPALP